MKKIKQKKVFEEAYDRVMAMSEQECDELVRVFVEAMNDPASDGKKVLTAFDLLPKLEHLETFASIKAAAKTEANYRTLAKVIVDEALALVGQYAMEKNENRV